MDDFVVVEIVGSLFGVSIIFELNEELNDLIQCFYNQFCDFQFLVVLDNRRQVESFLLIREVFQSRKLLVLECLFDEKVEFFSKMRVLQEKK